MLNRPETLETGQVPGGDPGSYAYRVVTRDIVSCGAQGSQAKEDPCTYLMWSHFLALEPWETKKSRDGRVGDCMDYSPGKGILVPPCRQDFLTCILKPRMVDYDLVRLDI